MSHPGTDVPVRIVKKKGKHGGGHSGGAWKVAYADFVTAMMALFIVLWIVGQSKQVKESVASYFKDPGVFFESTKAGGMLQGTNLAAKQQVDANLKTDEQKLKEMTESILKTLGKDHALSKLLEQIKIDSVEEGMRIELLEASKAYFFDVGTSTLKPEAIQVLAIIAGEVGKLPNKIIVEGHTDSRPYSRADGYTNFELSAERANSARRILVVHGVKEHQIDEVRGYADSRLRNAKDPFDVTNRRISIIIEWQNGKKHGNK